MIFVTLGTHNQPFERALGLVAPLDRDNERVIQHGATPPRPDLVTADWFGYLEFKDLLATIHAADVVISHAGVGSMITAIRNGKKPLVMARLRRFGEHVDDHQVELANRFADRGLVLACGPADRMEDLVRELQRSSFSVALPQNAGLREALARAALGRVGTNRTLTDIGRAHGLRIRHRSTA